jgi:hypothetical protein
MDLNIWVPILGVYLATSLILIPAVMMIYVRRRLTTPIVTISFFIGFMWPALIGVWLLTVPLGWAFVAILTIIEWWDGVMDPEDDESPSMYS